MQKKEKLAQCQLEIIFKEIHASLFSLLENKTIWIVSEAESECASQFIAQCFQKGSLKKRNKITFVCIVPWLNLYDDLAQHKKQLPEQVANHDVFILYNPHVDDDDDDNDDDGHDRGDEENNITNYFLRDLTTHMTQDEICLDKASCFTFKMPLIQLFLNDTPASLNCLTGALHSDIVVIIKGTSLLADHIYDCIKGTKDVFDYNSKLLVNSSECKNYENNLKTICSEFSQEILLLNLENRIKNYEDFRKVAILRNMKFELESETNELCKVTNFILKKIEDGSQTCGKIQKNLFIKHIMSDVKFRYFKELDEKYFDEMNEFLQFDANPRSLVVSLHGQSENLDSLHVEQIINVIFGLARNLDLYIMTNGTNKCLSDLLQQIIIKYSQMSIRNRKKLFIIGIVSLDDLRKQTSLLSNHTHFCIAKEGRDRFPLKHLLSKRILRTSDMLSISPIEMFIGGNVQLTEIMHEAIEFNHLVVLMRGSGGTTDIVCSILRKSLNLPKEMITHIAAVEFGNNDMRINLTDYVHIYYLKKHEESIIVLDYLSIDLNDFFATAWMHSEKISIENILEKLVKVKNLEVIKKVVLRSGQEIKVEKLNEFVTQSLLDDDADLFEFFSSQSNFVISNYFDLQIKELSTCDHMMMEVNDFDNELPDILSRLTNKLLRKPKTGFYSSILKSCVDGDPKQKELETLPIKRSIKTELVTLPRENWEPLENGVVGQPSTAVNNFTISKDNDDRLKLLIWAILAFRLEIVKVLWHMIPDKISNALVISRIMNSLSQMKTKSVSQYRADELKRQSSEYEAIAHELLNIAQSKNESKTEDLLLRNIPTWNDNSCFTLAYEFEMSSIVQHSACRNIMKDEVEKQKIFFYLFTYFMFHVFHLGVFIYFMLFKFVPINSIKDLNWSEYIVWVWFFCFTLEEVFQLRQSGYRNYLRSYWNWMDICISALITSSLISRCLHFVVARILLSWLLALLNIRILQYFCFSEILGPKLDMILKMSRDMFFFLVILFIVIFSFGTFKESLTDGNGNEATYENVLNVIYYPFWSLFGELFLEDFQNQTICDSSGVSDIGDCWIRKAMIWIGYGAFMLFIVLLMNLMISMFSSTYNEVQDEGEKIYLIYRYKLMEEHEGRYLVTPLISVILRFIQLFYNFEQKTLTYAVDNDEIERHFITFFGADEANILNDFEENCALVFRNEREKGSLCTH